MESSGGRSSSGVDREMLEKWDERDKWEVGGDGGFSLGGVLGLLGVDTDIKKPPVDVALSPSLLLSDMYLAMSSRILSGDKIYDELSSVVSKASSSSSTPGIEREDNLEVMRAIV